MDIKKLRIIIIVIFLMLLCIMNFTQVIYAEVYGSISGKVIYADTREPVKGISISIDVLDPSKCGTTKSCGYDSYKETDDNGNYVFEKVPAGEYKIELEFYNEFKDYTFDTTVENYSKNFSQDDIKKYDLYYTRNSRTGRQWRYIPLNLKSGTNVTEFNLKITKKIFGTISGTVKDENGNLLDIIKELVPEKNEDKKGDIKFYSRMIKSVYNLPIGKFSITNVPEYYSWNIIIRNKWGSKYNNYDSTTNIVTMYDYVYPQKIAICDTTQINLDIICKFDTLGLTTGTLYGKIFDNKGNPISGSVSGGWKNSLGLNIHLIPIDFIASQRSINFNDKGEFRTRGIPPGKWRYKFERGWTIREEIKLYNTTIFLPSEYVSKFYFGTTEIKSGIQELNLIYDSSKMIEERTKLYSQFSCNSNNLNSSDDSISATCEQLCEAKHADIGKGRNVSFCKTLKTFSCGCIPVVDCDASTDPDLLAIFWEHENCHKIICEAAVFEINGKRYSKSEIACDYDSAYTDDFYKYKYGKTRDQINTDNLIPDNYYSEYLCRSRKSLNSKLEECTKNMGFGKTSDWCDEQFAVNAPTIPTPIYYSQLPDAAILDNGASEQIQSLISTFRYGNIITDINTTPKELLDFSKVCVIPTGGLVGNDSSPQFKSLLEQYVSAGGFLVVMATQHNSDLSCIPVPAGDTLSGFMWREDMSCTANSIEIQNWHNILAGQNKNILSEPVDGYFTAWPSNSKILLRRSKNGQPCMLLYRYGSGWVLATTIYTDYGYSVGQASQSGKNLIRDIITWAKNPVDMAEYRPGASINIPITITNKTEMSVNSVSVSVLTPNGGCNRSDEERTITAKYFFPHHYWNTSYGMSSPTYFIGDLI